MLPEPADAINRTLDLFTMPRREIVAALRCMSPQARQRSDGRRGAS
jgi:hypothetical protein